MTKIEVVGHLSRLVVLLTVGDPSKDRQIEMLESLQEILEERIESVKYGYDDEEVE